MLVFVFNFDLFEFSAAILEKGLLLRTVQSLIVVRVEVPFKLISQKHFAFFSSAVPIFPRPHQTKAFFSQLINCSSMVDLFCCVLALEILPNDEAQLNVSRTSTIDLHGLCFGCFSIYLQFSFHWTIPLQHIVYESFPKQTNKLLLTT